MLLNIDHRACKANFLCCNANLQSIRRAGLRTQKQPRDTQLPGLADQEAGKKKLVI
jgi:hypothetical protein